MGSIYKITNKINGKCYIGQAQDIKSRFRNHRANAFCKNIKNRNNTPKLYHAFRKYGLDKFEFNVISNEIENFQLDFWERFYICLYNSIHNGYNITPGGNTQLGVKRSEETKLKISKAKTGILTTEKAREMARMLIGTHRRQSTKDKISKALSGRKISQETRNKQSIFRTGKLLSEETKNKLVEKSIKYNYLLRSPDNIIHDTNNLEKFCKGFNIDPSCMGKVSKGKLTQHKGWTCISRNEIPSKSLIKI